MMQAAIQKEQADESADGRFAQGGASGAEALMYMKSSEGDPNKVLIAYSLIYMLPLAAKISVQLARTSPRCPSSRWTSSSCGTTRRCRTRR